jgi:calcineurin-like phosphoesterase family protein
MVQALIFSDIHNDGRALAKLMAIEADVYFAAGDLVSWARGLDKMGDLMKSRAERVYVLPGNHESASRSIASRKDCMRAAARCASSLKRIILSTFSAGTFMRRKESYSRWARRGR